MGFTRKSASLVPIKDTVFAIVELARKDKQENGPDKVWDGTIGSLYGEDGKLVAYDTVFHHYDEIDDRIKAAYAVSFTGNPDYREDVWNWVTQGSGLCLPHSVIATTGGTGAVSLTMTSLLDAGQAVLLPDIAWGSYKLMAAQFNFRPYFYHMFDGDRFNLKSIKEQIEKIQEENDRVVLLINAPCHNPTGYSLSDEEWGSLVEILNEASRRTPVTLINDIAYIDYSYNLEESRKYMRHFNDISDNVMVAIAFSCSKTLTSYGLRCGAAVLVAKNQQDVRNMEIVMEKSARATWSNIPNAAMVNFSWITAHNREAFLKEKQSYVDLMKQRSDLFLKQATECGLDTYPYKEGFFVTLRIPEDGRAERVHDAFMKQHIYTVLVNRGIRVAVCSLPLNKVEGLAYMMKKIEDQVK